MLYNDVYTPHPETVSVDVTNRIISFLESIGITVQKSTITEETFLPGILISHGTLVIDEEKLLYPGDLLHEAGHIAVVAPADRSFLYNSVVHEGVTKDRQAMEEMAAIAWSYAASVHLGIDPQVVFHENGYKGGSDSLIDNFTNGKYLGAPALSWMRMCNDKKIVHTKDAPYPYMIRWMRA